MNPRLFGCSVSLADNILVVGAPSVRAKGSVYTYLLNTNNVDERTCALKPKNGHLDDGFGISCKVHSVSSTKLVMIVGAHRKINQGVSSGSAYVYSSDDLGNTWCLMKELEPYIKSHKSFFGCSVDINNNIAVVGAYGDNTEGLRVGSVCVFDTNSWSCLKCIYPSLSPNTRNLTCLYFGFSVSLSNNFLAIGSPSETGNGSVYLYNAQKDWETDTTYRKLDGDNRFGFSVNVYDDQVIIGTPGTNGNTGKANTYNISAFYDIELGFVPATMSKDGLFCETIHTKSKSSRALFGRSVAMHDKFLLVSGFGKTNEESFVGSAFVYLRNSCSENIEPLACLRDKDAAELFGHQVSISNDFIVIGDPTANKVHVYILGHLMGSSLRKWNSSSHCIQPDDEFALEIH